VIVAPETFRRVPVKPLSVRSELAALLRLSMTIVIGVWIYLATDSAAFREGGSGKNLLPFQSLIGDRPSTEQRMFRELQEGLLEAETRRVDTGKWPAVSLLIDEGIPPFAVDPTAKGGQYNWDLVQRGPLVNYLGLPHQAGSPAWLLLIQEPEPGAPPDQAREDEEHHRQPTGAMLHVSTWVRSDGRVTAGIIRTPQAEGWMQLYAVGPAFTPSKNQ